LPKNYNKKIEKIPSGEIPRKDLVKSLTN